MYIQLFVRPNHGTLQEVNLGISSLVSITLWCGLCSLGVWRGAYSAISHITSHILLLCITILQYIVFCYIFYSFSGVRPTRYSDRLHDFSVTIPRCYNNVYVNSFFPRRAKFWNSLPVESLPLTYDLSGFKCRINRHLLTLIWVGWGRRVILPPPPVGFLLITQER